MELIDADGNSTSVRGGSDVAKHPLANHQPRQHTAKAKTSCKITRFDSDLLDILLTWDQLSGIEVNEIQVEEEGGDDGDWMTRILQSQAFLQVPPANIQAMFMRIQEVPVSAGEVIMIGTLVALYQYVGRFVDVFFSLAWQYEQVVWHHTDIKAVDVIRNAYSNDRKVLPKEKLPKDWFLQKMKQQC